jgi:hypothetical protein
MSQGEPSNEFTVLDWIGTLVALASVVALLGFPFIAKSFRAMFLDFGNSLDSLPLLTRLALTPWFPLVLASPACLCLWAGSRRARPLRQRRLFVVGAFVLGIAGLAVCFVGVYEPVFQVSDKIKAD